MRRKSARGKRSYRLLSSCKSSRKLFALHGFGERKKAEAMLHTS